MIDETSLLPPLFPLVPVEYLGFGLATLGLVIAAGGGLGGGGICLPIYILILGIPVKQAIPLTSITVLGGALANNLLNVRKQHPEHPSRGVVDWDLLLQLEPMAIAGTQVGALLNNLLPEVVLVLVLFVVLSAMAYVTLVKAHALYDKETALLTAAAATKDEETSLVQSDTGYGAVGGTATKLELQSESSLDDDKPHPAWKDALKLTGLVMAVSVINFLKQGQSEGKGRWEVPTCGRCCFWFSQLAMLTFILLFCLWKRASLLQRVRSGAIIHSDIAWNESNTIRYPAMVVVAGLVAGLTGTGGGILKAPIMLAIGVHSSVVAGTSAMMILFTSSTATISYLIFGLLVHDYALACLILGFAATIVGQTVMSWLLARYQRPSYIAFSIGWVVAISAVCMTVECVLTMIHDY